MLTPDEMARLAVKALDSKKASNIKLLKTEDLTILANFFIICTAASTTQMKTLADEVDRVLTENGEPSRKVEGDRAGGWILVDFGCLVVHVFLKDTRDFYSLEHLWSDAPEIDISDLLNNQ